MTRHSDRPPSRPGRPYQALLSRAGYGPITTEIRDAPTFYYAEPYHQQYLAKNPRGYCGLSGTGIACPVGAFGAAEAVDRLQRGC